MQIPVRSILGLADIPSHRTSAVAWLKRHGVTVEKAPCNGGLQDVVNLTDLPEAVQLAFRLRQIEAAGLPMGQQDDAARMAFEAKPLTVQDAGHERAGILLFVHKHRAAGLTFKQIRPLLAKAGLGEAPCDQTLNRWFERVVNVDPVNWAAALAPHYEGKKISDKISAEAWDYFEFLVAAGGGNGTGFPLKQVWEKTLARAEAEGWAADASYRTYLRRWDALPAARRRTLEKGAAAAAASLTMTQPRTAVGLPAMEQVELDGREFGVLVRWPDGKISCPWVIMYCDRASSKVLSWAISTSENAEATREATINLCEDHGIPDWVLTDNSTSFNGKVMAGGLKPLYRTKQMESPDWEVPGVFKIYGIELQNTAPGKPRGKLPESIFSALRHVDNSPEFYGAQRSGPNDIPNPNPVPIDLDLFQAVFEKRIREFNSMTNSRAQSLRKGESRNEAFERLSEGRVKRNVMPLMRRSVPMIWKKRKVREDGRVPYLDGFYGDATTQDAMLEHEGTIVLIGIDPKDYHAPAVVRGWEVERFKGRVLIEKLPAYKKTAVRDEAGMRLAMAENRRVKSVTKSHEIRDIDARVEALRAATMAEAALFAASKPAIVAPTVHQLDTRGPFSAAAAFHQIDTKTGELRATNDESEAAQAALLEFMFPSKGMERREASGGNR